MKTLQEIIDRSKRVVFFGGAGVSTESGIPDFRSAGGLYKSGDFAGLSPETILSDTFFYRHTDLFYQYYRKHLLYPDAKPNAAHIKLFELERIGKLRGIVTQNIDGLHRAAGNKLVYELHGTVYENECLDCGQSYSLQWLMKTEGVPRCPKCGGIIKPKVVLYGEGLDPYVMRGAIREIASCDTLIVAGTSLMVQPAASFLSYFQGQELVIINRDPTPADAEATLVLHAPVAQTLGAISVEGGSKNAHQDSGA